MVTIQCRDHGGTFQIQPKRGRRPVRCNPQNTCTRGGIEPQATPQQVAKAVSRVEFSETITRTVDTAKARQPALAAKARLEEQGWQCAGRGWVDEDGGVGVELSAVRGDELLVMYWMDGECTLQDYSLWSEKPSANNKPAGKLTFDPDECTDRELVRALAGCKVTWWNVLGQKEEEATIAPESMKIEHAYNGHGDEMPGDRIVKFIEHGGAGYRAFRVAALLKVG